MTSFKTAAGTGVLLALILGALVFTTSTEAAIATDLSHYRPGSGVKVAVAGPIPVAVATGVEGDAKNGETKDTERCNCRYNGDGDYVCDWCDVTGLAVAIIIVIIIVPLIILACTIVLICYCCACCCFVGRRDRQAGQVIVVPQQQQQQAPGYYYGGQPPQGGPDGAQGGNMMYNQQYQGPRGAYPQQQAPGQKY